MKSRPRQHRFVLDLTSAERSLRRWIDRRSGGDLTAAGAGALHVLAANPGTGLRQLAAALNASPAGTSGLVSRLEKAGLVDRSPAPDDARAVRLTLTPAGQDALARTHHALAELNTHLQHGFTADELGTVARWLAHVRRLDDR